MKANLAFAVTLLSLPLNFEAAARERAMNVPGCDLAPIRAETDIADVVALGLPGSLYWMGIVKEGLLASDPGSVDGWTNLIDDSNVPPTQAIWKPGEPDNANSVLPSDVVTIGQGTDLLLRDVTTTAQVTGSVWYCVLPSAPPSTAPEPSQCEEKGFTAEECESAGYRNRNLKTIDTQFLTNDHKQCMDVYYDMFLVIEGIHFAGLAVPLAEASSCPSVVFHSTIAADKTVEKVVMLADQEEVATFDSDSMHHLGSRPLSTIVKAFEHAPVGKDGAKFYDSITNNCVSLLRNMADPLAISVNDNDSMIEFIAKKLLSTGNIHLWDGIMNSPSLDLVVEGGKRMLKAANQEDLVRKLIKLYV